MEINKESQKAGENSTQIQADKIILVQGISEERARAICKEEFKVVAKTMTLEANNTALERVLKLENLIIPKFKEIDDSLKYFSDPSFQFTLRKAQESATLSDQERDYEALSELLACRITEGMKDRSSKIAIEKAIEIVSRIPDEALVGLIITYAITYIYPITEVFEERLRMYENIFANVLGKNPLPENERWYEDLDMLQIIRLNPQGVGRFLKMKDYIATRFKRQMVEGMSKNDPSFQRIKQNLTSLGIPPQIFITHPLREGYEILDIPEHIEDMRIIECRGTIQIFRELNHAQIIAIENAAKSINVDASQNNELKDKLIGKWNSFPTLKRITEWWDAIPLLFSITSAGKALANAYIRSKYPELPIQF